jgi:peptide-methionine (S)-S-oxide reductase
MNIFEIDVHSKKPDFLSKIFFGMGCFWGAEKRFWNLKGLYTTVVGYAGGHTPDPTYQEVCSGSTGHAEVVQVIYDQGKNSLEDLLKIFWESHDPTQVDRQGNDIGSQYRSIILIEDEKLIDEIEKSKANFQLNSSNLGKISTEIQKLKNFYIAEDYHQKYLHKNPNGYCGLRGLGINYDV